MARTSDRRVRRTRKALRGALLELIARKGFDEISVQEITNVADVGRATFYTHYADKDDLLRQSLADLGDHLRGRMKAQGDHSILAFSTPMLEHVAEVQPMFVALFASRVVQELFIEVLSEIIADTLKSRTLAAPQAVIERYLAASFLAVASWWVGEAPELSAEDVHGLYVSLVQPGLEPLLVDQT